MDWQRRKSCLPIVGIRVADMFTHRSENADKVSVELGIIEHVSE
jgi:hypothetical protein